MQGVGEAYACARRAPALRRSDGTWRDNGVTMCDKALTGDSYVAMVVGAAACDDWKTPTSRSIGLLVRQADAA